MGFFDKITDIVSSTGKELNKKAKDLVSVSKLEGQIAGEEDKISAAYAKIGEMYYQAHKDETGGPLVELCQEITTAHQTIDQLKKELEKLKGLQRCPVCGNSVSIEAAFCPSCGSKMPKVEEPAAVETALVDEVVAEEAEAVTEAEVQTASEEAEEKE